MVTQKTTKKRGMTAARSLKILKSIIDEERSIAYGFNWENHKKVENRHNVFNVTVEVMSLEILIDLMDHKNIKNVSWYPSAAPPARISDPVTAAGISMRFQLFVEYND